MFPSKLAIGFVAAVLIIGGTYFFAYRSGVASTVNAYNEKIIAMQNKLQAAKGKLAKAKGKREVVYREKINTVYKTNDKCGSARASDDILRSVRSGRTGR